MELPAAAGCWARIKPSRSWVPSPAWVTAQVQAHVATWPVRVRCMTCTLPACPACCQRGAEPEPLTADEQRGAGSRRVVRAEHRLGAGCTCRGVMREWHIWLRKVHTAACSSWMLSDRCLDAHSACTSALSAACTQGTLQPAADRLRANAAPDLALWYLSEHAGCWRAASRRCLQVLGALFRV